MAKEKYDKDTFPRLAEGLARDGANDKDIAIRLGISEGTFYTYTKKYAEFRDAIKEGRKPINYEIENKLLQRARGYKYTEVHVTKRNGKIIEEKEVTKEIPPDNASIFFFLKNKLPSKWRDKQVVGHELEALSDADLTKVINSLFTDFEDPKKEDK